MRISDLKQKEVININDCKRLGFVGDVDFDMETGCMIAIIVPGAWVHLRIFGKREGVCYSFLQYLPGGKRYYSGGRKGKKGRGKGEVPLRKQPRSAVSSGAVFKRMYV